MQAGGGLSTKVLALSTFSPALEHYTPDRLDMKGRYRGLSVRPRVYGGGANPGWRPYEKNRRIAARQPVCFANMILVKPRSGGQIMFAGVGLFLLCLATGLVGLIVVFPVLGHGTCHAYRAVKAKAA